MSVFIKDFNEFRCLCLHKSVKYHYYDDSNTRLPLMYYKYYCCKSENEDTICSEGNCPYAKATFKYDKTKKRYVDVDYLMNIIAKEDESFGYVCAYDIEHAPMIEEKCGNWMNLRTYIDEYGNKVNDFMCSNCCNVIRGVPENCKNMPKFCHECGVKMKEVCKYD